MKKTVQLALLLVSLTSILVIPQAFGGGAPSGALSGNKAAEEPSENLCPYTITCSNGSSASCCNTYSNCCSACSSLCGGPCSGC